MRLLLISLAALCAMAMSAAAQTPVIPMVQTATGTWVPVGTGGTGAIPMPVDAGVGTLTVPSGATAVQVSAAGTTLATVATMPATASVTNYLCGWSIDAQATAATSTGMTITGLLGGTAVFLQGPAAAPSFSTRGQTYAPCLPASAVNTAIVVTSSAPGAGGVIEVNAWGFRK